MAINSVQIQKGSTVKTVQVGSTAYNNYLSQGYTVVSGTEKNAPTSTKTTTTSTTSKSTLSSTGAYSPTASGTKYYYDNQQFYATDGSGNVVKVTDQSTLSNLYGGGIPWTNGPVPKTTTSSTSSSTSSDALKNLSIGLAQGAPITQQQINSGALKTGGQYDYGGKTDLQNLSIALAGGQKQVEQPIEPQTNTQPNTQEIVNQAIQSTPQASRGTVTQSGGAQPSSPSAGGATTGAAVSAPMGPVPAGTQYANINGAYFQQTPQGLLAVSDKNIIQGLRTGQIKSETQPLVAGGADRFVNPQQVSPATPTTFDTISSKFGLPAPQQMGMAFNADPIATIKDMTSQIFKAMGVDQANSMIEDIGDELEELENDRDDEIREVNDNPWLTEGVRQRQIAKVGEKYEDKINNRVNKLRLLESTRDDARQQAQFALGTAISMWDSQQRLQQQQVQMYYDQAQRTFENELELAKLNKQSDPNTTAEMNDYLFAVENGLIPSGMGYFDFLRSRYGATHAVTGVGNGTGGGVSGTGVGGITDATGKPIKLTATQVDAISGFDNTVDAAQRALTLLSQGVQTGPIAGRLLQGAKLIGNANPQQLQLEQIIGKIKADFMKAISGAAVSDSEVIRLSKFLPDITDQETVIQSKLNTLINETVNSKTNYLRTLGATTPANAYEQYLQQIGA